MGQILIRNLDDAVIDAYRQAATRNARSLEAELREVLRTCRPMAAQEIEDARAACGDPGNDARRPADAKRGACP